MFQASIREKPSVRPPQLLPLPLPNSGGGGTVCPTDFTFAQIGVGNYHQFEGQFLAPGWAKVKSAGCNVEGGGSSFLDHMSRRMGDFRGA